MVSKVENILKPCSYLFKLFGLYSLDVVNQQFSKNNNRNTGIAWSIFVVVYTISHSVYGLSYRSIHYESLLLTLTDTMQFVISLTNCGVSITFLTFMRNNLSSYLHKLMEYDRNFSYIDPAIKQKTNEFNKILLQYLTLILIIVICVYIWFDTTLYMTNYDLIQIGDCIAYCVPFIVGLLVTTQYCLLTLFVQQRFKWLNTKLFQIIEHQKKIRILGSKRNNQIIRTLETFRIKHDFLNNLCSLINKIYSIPTLLTILQNFIVIIVTLFMHLEKSRSYSKLLYDVFDCYIIAITAIELVFMAKISSKTREEAERTALILHKFEKTTTEIAAFIEFFSMQLMSDNVEFSACKVFRIDETLLFSMIGAISTYLIIVMQLQLDNN